MTSDRAPESEEVYAVEVSIRRLGDHGTDLTSIFTLEPRSVTFIEKREIDSIREFGETEISELRPRPDTHRLLIEGRVLDAREEP